MENKSPTVIKSFPGEGVERHLRKHGHLPDYGCCGYDQPIGVGDTVSFAHEDVHRKVLKATHFPTIGLMLKIEDMAGEFAASLFKKINYKNE